jgi:hypothetical protein
MMRYPTRMLRFGKVILPGFRHFILHSERYIPHSNPQMDSFKVLVDFDKINCLTWPELNVSLRLNFGRVAQLDRASAF